MFAYPEIKKEIDFDIKDLHKKIGQIIVMEPSDSDLQEGGPFNTQVWLVDSNQTWWLLGELNEE
jgi:hypothetical protein